MNSNIGAPSQSSSDNSSSDDGLQLMNDLEAINAEQKAILRMRANNNLLIVHYHNQQNNQVTHGGSIPCHIIIHRDCESVDRNLFNDYFFR